MKQIIPFKIAPLMSVFGNSSSCCSSKKKKCCEKYKKGKRCKKCPQSSLN